MIWRNWTHSHFVIPGLINQNYSIRYINTVSDSTVIPRCFLTLIHLSIWQSFDSHPKGFNLVQTFWQENVSTVRAPFYTMQHSSCYYFLVTHCTVTKENYGYGNHEDSADQSEVKVNEYKRYTVYKLYSIIYLFTTGFECIKALCLWLHDSLRSWCSLNFSMQVIFIWLIRTDWYWKVWQKIEIEQFLHGLIPDGLDSSDVSCATLCISLCFSENREFTQNLNRKDFSKQRLNGLYVINCTQSFETTLVRLQICHIWLYCLSSKHLNFSHKGLQYKFSRVIIRSIRLFYCIL